MRCVYAGSFDPITVGHMDVIRRAATMFDEVIVAVLINRAKRPVFTVEERLEQIRLAAADIPGVRTDSFEGLLVDYLRSVDARVILRGLRGTADFESERTVASLNRGLYPQAETVFLMTSPEYACVSSSAVREIASFGGDISALVPQPILDRVNNGFDIYFNRKQREETSR